MQNRNAEEQVDELPLDLLTQVARRLGIDRQAALAVLGGWLVAYEPTSRGTIQFLK